MTDINDLGWTDNDEELQGAPEIPDELPRERRGGSRPPVPQPGTYVFKVPDSGPKIERIVDGNKELMKASFAEETSLIASPGNIPVRHTFTNKDRIIYGFENGEKTETKVEGGNAAYYLKAVKGPKPVNKTAKAWAEAIAKTGGASFKARVVLTGFCNPEREVYAKDGDSFKVLRGIYGDGQRFAEKGFNKKDGTSVFAIPKNEDGTTATEFPYQMRDPRDSKKLLTVMISAFPQLEDVRAVD